MPDVDIEPYAGAPSHGGGAWGRFVSTALVLLSIWALILALSQHSAPSQNAVAEARRDATGLASWVPSQPRWLSSFVDKHFYYTRSFEWVESSLQASGSFLQSVRQAALRELLRDVVAR